MRAFAEATINTTYAKNTKARFYARRYEQGGLAIQLTAIEEGDDSGFEEPLMTATFNPIEPLAEDEIAIKDWAENAGIYKEMLRLELIEPQHRIIEAGFAFGFICRLTPQAKELIRLVEQEEAHREARAHA